MDNLVYVLRGWRGPREYHSDSGARAHDLQGDLAQPVIDFRCRLPIVCRVALGPGLFRGYEPGLGNLEDD